MSESHRLLRVRAIRSIEDRAGALLPTATLMRRAARSAANLIVTHWPTGIVAILCGPGNNGGDGAILARLLHQAGREVRVWALPQPDRHSTDSEQAWADCPAALIQPGHPDEGGLPSNHSMLIVDALFGIGLARPLSDTARRWIAWANAHPADILALDVPTGLDADHGTVSGIAIEATHTLTFIADKPGLRTLSGPDHCGAVHVDSLDLQEMLAETFEDVGDWIRRADCPQLFSPRKHDTHKGSFGTVGLVAGAPGMTGAALLAGRAALRLGAGKVLIGLAGPHPPALACDPLQPELMVDSADGLLERADHLGISVWIAGCGLGDSPQATAWLERTLKQDLAAPLVLDADALNLLAASAELERLLALRTGIKVLTPHPREAARLLTSATETIQADRIGSAQTISRRFNAWTILKGAGSIVSSPNAAWSINSSGNAGLATAGTGDVLAGMTGSLLAQGLDAAAAVRGAVWLHGAAADHLARRGIGPMGMTAGEVIDAARWVRNAPGP